MLTDCTFIMVPIARGILLPAMDYSVEYRFVERGSTSMEGTRVIGAYIAQMIQISLS